MAMKSEEENMSYYGPLIDDMRNVLNNRKDWHLQFDYRENNIVSHTLAKAALNLVEEKVWIEEIPDFIVNSLEKDRKCMYEDHI